MATLRYYMPGIILIMTGLMILAFPEIFIAFIGTLILIGGIIALHIGHTLRGPRSELRDNSNNWFFGEDYFGLRYMRIPVFRDYRRRH